MATLEVKEHDAYSDISISGALTIFSAREFCEAYLKPLSYEKSLILDLTQVDEIDTAGIQLLLLLSQTAKNEGKGCEVSDISDPLKEYLDLFNLNEQFPLSGLILA